jgi:hypothetical protein
LNIGNAEIHKAVDVNRSGLIGGSNS